MDLFEAPHGKCVASNLVLQVSIFVEVVGIKEIGRFLLKQLYLGLFKTLFWTINKKCKSHR